MKKHILIIVLMAAAAAIHAEPADTLRPVAGEKQFVMLLGTNTSSFLIKKYKTASFAWRYGLGGSYNLDKQSNTTSTTSTTVSPYYDRESSNNNRYLGLFVSFGFQKSFGNFKNFEPYTGMDFGLGNRMEKWNSESKYTSVGPEMSPGAQIGNKTETTRYLNFSTTLAPFIGFNYYLAERFALGAEYRFNLLSLGSPGNSKTTYTTYYYQADPSVGTTTNENKGVYLNGGFNGYAQLTVTMFIGKTKR